MIRKIFQIYVKPIPLSAYSLQNLQNYKWKKLIHHVIDNSDCQILYCETASMPNK